MSKSNDSDRHATATHRAHACWIEMDIDTEYPSMCFETEDGEELVVELGPGAATDLRDTVVEHGVVEQRRHDHSGRKPDDIDTSGVESVMRDALGDDYDAR